ncbi:MutS-related protein [Pectinatus frisingensis]|uniref:MutS-related protein n=1 Tax=Pectinatus frisingensis TaxID=865 RepID=UPI0018C6D55A|nr:hypothetical protein [Pectinatus frisingensis]
MKAFLMYKDHNFDSAVQLPANAQSLIQDLELNSLFTVMADNDKFLFEIAQKVILNSLLDKTTIIYRQTVLTDCLKNPAVIKTIYDLSIEAIKCEKKQYLWRINKYPSAILHRALNVLHSFMKLLKNLRNIAEIHKPDFISEGFVSFFTLLQNELNDEYLANVEACLSELNFTNGILISARLGKGSKGINYILRKNHYKKKGWLQRFFAHEKKFTIYIKNRDENGARALSQLNDQGINATAAVLAQSADHILAFFNMLRCELAFYIGCINLHHHLHQIGLSITFPQPVSSDKCCCSFQCLTDIPLSLHLKSPGISNNLSADNKYLIIITGANQGGKSTFLRSIGVAHLLMQCGMYVPAKFFRANICHGIFTHYKREEDINMNSGKLDEELFRMNIIADNIFPHSLILFNESFAATNEREGSEISEQIVQALLESHIKVFFVTHQYTFANKFYQKNSTAVLFLRAERKTDKKRTFKLIEGGPLSTSYGADLYYKIF